MGYYFTFFILVVLQWHLIAQLIVNVFLWYVMW